MMTLSVGPAPVKVTTRVKATVTRFDSKATITLHAHTFGLGVSPIDYDALADEVADYNALCEGMVYSRDDLDAAPIEVEPIAPAPDVYVSTYSAETQGRFNTLIHDWSMANWPVDDDDAAQWAAFQDARNAEESRLRAWLWPQAASPVRHPAPKPAPKPRPIAKPRPKRMAVASKPYDPEAHARSIEAYLARASFNPETDGNDWHATESRRQACQLAAV